MSDGQLSYWEAAFERHGEGYVYYANRWAPGVPVTAEEHDQVVAAGLSGFPEFRRAIRGRAPVVPPRNATALSKSSGILWGQFRIIREQMVGGLVATGVILLVFGLTQRGWWEAFFVAAGALELLTAVWVWTRGRSR